MTQAALRITDEAITSPIFRIRGQRSRWRYGDPRLSPEYCEVLRNVDISERGIPEARTGYALYNSTQLSGAEPVVGLWEGTFSNGNVRRVVVTPTAVYNDDGTTRTTITGTALTGGNDDRVEFYFLKDQLVFNNTVDAPRVWDGDISGPTNTSALATIPYTACGAMTVHKNLLMAFDTTEGGTRFPTRVRWCDINRRTYVVDINTWPDANRYEIYDGGPAIVGAVDAWGVAMVFKEDGLYPGEIFYDVLGHYDFRMDKPRRGFTPVSRMSLVSRPEFVCGVAEEGIFAFAPDLSFSIVNSDDLQEFLDLNRGRWQYIQAFVRERDHQVRFLVSSSGNTTFHDQILVWDWQTGDTWIDIPADKLGYGGQVTVSNEVLDWFGSSDGYLYQGDKGAYLDDNGTSFTWRIKMSPNDLGLPGKQKHIVNVRTLFRKRANAGNVSVVINLDEGRTGPVRGSFDAGTEYEWSTGVKWNSGKKWPGATGRRADTFVNRIAETVAPEWQGTGPAAIEGYLVEYIPLES